MQTKKKKNPVESIIEEFGGLRATARACKRAPSAIHRWRVNERIPVRSLPDVMKGLKRNGLTYEVNRFM
jgi:hypothetical protein